MIELRAATVQVAAFGVEPVMQESSQQSMFETRRRAAARRTALIMGGVALVVFVLSLAQMLR